MGTIIIIPIQRKVDRNLIRNTFYIKSIFLQQELRYIQFISYFLCKQAIGLFMFFYLSVVLLKCISKNKDVENVTNIVNRTQ